MTRKQMIEVVAKEMLINDGRIASSPDPRMLRYAEIAIDTAERSGMFPPSVRFLATGEIFGLKELDIFSDYDIEFTWKE